MSVVLDAFEDLVGSLWDAFVDVVEAVWDAVVEPLIEPIFAIFGIEDETVVSVIRVSSKVFGTNTEDVVKAALVRAVLGKISQNNDYFPHYMQEIYRTKGQVKAYYNYADLGIYVNGLPDMRITGTAGGFDEIQLALDDFTGSTNLVLSATSQHPLAEQVFQYDLQSTHDYHLWDNSLTATDIYGAEWSDWQMGAVTYNVGPNDYTIDITRTAEEALFWIEGFKQITEGDTAVYTIKCNRPVPIGESVDINFTYAGTAVDGVDYTEVASVTMLSGTSEVLVNIVTAETGNANRNFTITIGSITNTNAAFQMVSIHTLDNIASTITDDDTLRLTANDVIVDEANTTITIAVKLEQAAPSGAFSVDFNFTDLGSITGGVDYDNTPGTLNFAGTVGEVQNVNVDIYTDVADDDREQFEVWFDNSTDVDGIDISIVATVTILDGTSDPVVGNNTLADTITKPAYVDEESLVIRYEDDSNPPGEILMWIYKFSDGTYPNLGFNVSEISNMEMLPVAVLRRNHTTIAGAELLSTENLMRRLSFEVDDFIEAINTNPDIAVVDDAYVNFSASPNDTNKVVSKILYLTWFEIVVQAALTSNVDEFKATFEEGDVNNAIVWKFHSYTQDIAGVVTTEGDYIHSTTGTTLFLRYQKTATEYDEMEVNNLNGLTSIAYAGHHQIALNVLGDDNFTFPISWFIFNQLTAKEQLEVYQYLLRIDFYAIQITELEWYETAAFWDLFEFVLVILTIVTFDYSGTWISIGYSIVESYVVNYAIAELIIWVAEATGNEVLAAIAGLVAAIALSDPKAFTNNTLMQAESLIDLATEFVNNLALLANEEAIQIANDLTEATAAAQEKIDEEKQNRDDIGGVELDSAFIAYMQSVDTSYFPAIQGQYEYNQLYNYDSLVGDYHDRELRIGVN